MKFMYIIKKYEEYFELNEEIKTYQLYKGVSNRAFNEILKDMKIKNDGKFNSPLRKIVSGKENSISATRNIRTAFSYGSIIFVFNMLKLSSRFKIVPFCENPDYYLDYPDFDNLTDPQLQLENI